MRTRFVAVLASILPAAACLADPWSLTDPVFDPTDGIRILVYHDMEGLAGQDDIMSYVYGQPEYALGQEMLAADLNAVIEGLFQAGAAAVDVVDAHGSLNPEPDVRRDLLDPRAQQVFRSERFDGYIDIIEPGHYDAVVAVANHGKTGSGGFAAHTKTLGMEVQYGGLSVTETEMIALSWGEVGVPMILVTGDDRLRKDLSTMPWIEYVTTKKATGVDSVELRPVPEVHAEMTAAARRALNHLGKARAMKIRLPVTVTVRAVHPASLVALKNFPGVDYADQSSSFEAITFESAYRGANAIIDVARGGWFNAAIGRLIRDGKLEVYNEMFMALGAEWVDTENGDWKAPPPSGPRRYHGSE